MWQRHEVFQYGPIQTSPGKLMKITLYVEKEIDSGLKIMPGVIAILMSSAINYSSSQPTC
jgi:hypothetical protein